MILKSVNSIIQLLEFSLCTKTENVKTFSPDQNIRLGGCDATLSEITTKIKNWYYTPNSTALEFKLPYKKGVYIRVNKSSIILNDSTISIIDRKAISIFYRHKVTGKKGSTMTLISHFSENIDEIVNDRIELLIINSKRQTLEKNKFPINNHMPTVRDFLPVYEKILFLKNPGTVKRKLTLIQNHFSHLLDLKVDQIKGKHLIEYVYNFKRYRTPLETQKKESPYIKKESTIKGYVCCFRALLTEAAQYADHSFDLCPSLYSKSLHFYINNESDKYLTKDEITYVFESLRNRDSLGIDNTCLFIDYLTPFIALCISTGLRPGHALSIRKSDINFISKKILIRGAKGKIETDQLIDIAPELEWVLTEWLKNKIHTKDNNWLFPSPKKSGVHLTSYKTTFTTFRNNYNINDFVIYDLRHTFATFFTILTKEINKTQKALHHRKVATTRRYARVIDSHITEDMKKISCQLIPRTCFPQNTNI